MASLGNVYIAFTFIACGGLLFGYIIGITSNVITEGQLECPKDWAGKVGDWTSFGYKQCYEINALEKGILSSLNLIGALISSLFCFGFSDYMGRKLEVQIGAMLYLLGAGIASASPVLWGIYLGLTVYGLGIGFAMHAAPVYIAELSPASIRGTLVSAKEAVVVLGIFLGFATGAIFSNFETLGWRYMVACSAVLALIMEVGITFIPESPRFLVLRAVVGGGLLGADESLMTKACNSLTFFRSASTCEIDAELQAMRSAIASAVGEQAAKVTDAFRFPLPLVIGCGLVFLQQVTGQPSVLYFATNVFKDAGFGTSAATLSSLGVGLVKLLATLFTVWRVDRYGRRLLLFIGISMMTFALAVVGVAFLFREKNCRPGTDCDADNATLPKGWAITTVVALMVYVSGYQVGFGPIAWLMISEVFPVSVRGAALSVAAVVNFGFNILVTLTQEVLMNALTPSGVFFSYMALSIVSLIFVKAIVPETKGKTLEEIEQMLSRRKVRAPNYQNDPSVGA